MADAAETDAIEAWLSGGSPAAAAQYAEATAVFNAMALGLTPVEPPDAVRHAVFARVTADASGGADRSKAFGGPLRWPVYVSTGLAACLAVALTTSLLKNNELSGRAEALAANLTRLEKVQNQQPPTSAGLRQLMASPYLSLASLTTARPATTAPSARPAGRVLFCPVTKLYQVTVFGLPPLPKGREYELWLITPDKHMFPSGRLRLDDQGVATVMTHPDNVAVAAQAAVSDEPAGQSSGTAPTGAVHLNGTLQPNG